VLASSSSAQIQPLH